MEQIRVIGFEIEACHGCSPGEKTNPQRFLLNVTVDIADREKQDDDLETTLSYLDVIEICRSVMNGPHRHLMETLAGEIADRIVALKYVAGVEIEIEKCNPPIPDFTGRVGVRIYREASV